MKKILFVVFAMIFIATSVFAKEQTRDYIKATDIQKVSLGDTFEQVTEEFRAKLAVCTVCDEAGEVIFNKEDYLKLSANIGAARLEKIVNAAQKLNAITKEDQEALVKNSESDREDNSSSGSVKN